MKLSKKLRLIFSLASLLVCMCMSFVTVGADVMDYSDMMSEEEMTTTVDDTILYADGKVTLATLKSTFDTYAQQLASVSALSYDELKYLDTVYASQTDFYGSYAKIAGEEGCGTYVGYENIKVEETDDKNVLKVTADTLFSEKNLKMTLNITVYDNIGVVVTSTEFGLADEAEESFKDKMLTATGNTLLGMGTVFVVLILISLIISCFAFIPKIQAKFAKKEKIESDVPVEDKTVVEEVSTDAGTDDAELIAVIAAAIAASENTTTDGFVVRTIRKRKNS